MKRISLLVICYSIFLFSFTPQSALADPDCSTNQVSLGEVMAGLQAGLTSAGITEETLASGFFDASSISGSPTRGFVIPEAGFDTQHCENDYILIGE